MNLESAHANMFSLVLRHSCEALRQTMHIPCDYNAVDQFGKGKFKWHLIYFDHEKKES